MIICKEKTSQDIQMNFGVCHSNVSEFHDFIVLTKSVFNF